MSKKPSRKDLFFQRYAREKPEAHAKSSRRGQQQSLKARQARKQKRIDQALKLSDEGLSAAEVATRLQVHPDTVRRWLKDHKPKPKPEPKLDPKWAKMLPSGYRSPQTSVEHRET